VTAEAGTTEGAQVAGRWSERQPRRAVLAYVAAYVAAAAVGGALVLLPLPRPALAVLVTVVGTVATALSLLLVQHLPGAAERLDGGGAALPDDHRVLLQAAEVTVRLTWCCRCRRSCSWRARRFVWRGQDLVGNIALILWAVLIGKLVSRIIREGKLLLPVLVASLVDIYTVFWGFVGKVVDKAPAVGQPSCASAGAELARQVALPSWPHRHGRFPVHRHVPIGGAPPRHARRAAMWAAFVSMLAAAVVLVLWSPPGILPALHLDRGAPGNPPVLRLPQEAVAGGGRVVVAVAAAAIAVRLIGRPRAVVVPREVNRPTADGRRRGER
jgi:hypothetical protein